MPSGCVDTDQRFSLSRDDRDPTGQIQPSNLLTNAASREHSSRTRRMPRLFGARSTVQPPLLLSRMKDIGAVPTVDDLHTAILDAPLDNSVGHEGDVYVAGRRPLPDVAGDVEEAPAVGAEMALRLQLCIAFGLSGRLAALTRQSAGDRIAVVGEAERIVVKQFGGEAPLLVDQQTPGLR